MRGLAILLAIMVGCGGGSAEAKPRNKITVRVALVGYNNWCDYSPFIGRLAMIMARDVSRKIKIEWVQDIEEQFSGPALTIEAFWDKSLYNYWQQRIPPTGGQGIRMVVLPALTGGYYGGWSSGRCDPLGGWMLVNLEPGPQGLRRSALIVAHELGHLLGATHCGGGRHKENGIWVDDPPSIMDADAGAECKPLAYECGYRGASAYQIRRCLHIRRARL